MAKGQQRGNNEARKPKKTIAKPILANPSTKRTLPNLMKN